MKMANITPSTQAAGSVPAVEREQERIAFKDAHRHLELYEVPDAWGRPMFKHSHVEASWLGWIARASHGQAPAGARYEKGLEDVLRERDEADDYIDTLLDEVLGADRAEWSSAYGRADALEEVRERITALHKPAVERAWKQFEAATKQPGDVVAYLDVGAGGYLDLDAALSDEAMQQLPKGRHALVIAGTYGIDGYVAAPQPSPTTKPAPQQEAQEALGYLQTGDDHAILEQIIEVNYY